MTSIHLPAVNRKLIQKDKFVHGREKYFQLLGYFGMMVMMLSTIYVLFAKMGNILTK